MLQAHKCSDYKRTNKKKVIKSTSPLGTEFPFQARSKTGKKNLCRRSTNKKKKILPGLRIALECVS